MNKRIILFIVLIYSLVFENPLEMVWEPFKYIDEIISLFGVGILAYQLFRGRIKKTSKDTVAICILLVIFGISGLAGNIIYQYQPIQAVVVDLFTNYKFFFAVLVGYFILQGCSWDKLKKYANMHARIITVILGIVFLFDRIFNWYPAEIRYGIKSARLFYQHPTYLVGIVVFLIVLLVCFYERKNIPYLIINLIIMIFTLRSKALVSVVIFGLLYVFCIVYDKRIKMKHFILLGGLALILGYPMIDYYYINAPRMPRSILTLTSFKIMKDYFPIGTGFGTYASNMAAEYYSPVYIQYGFLEISEVSPTSAFLNDTFWPIIIGQTGLIGIIVYLGILWLFLKKCINLQTENKYAYIGALFVMVYLGISSTAEPAFNNALSLPLAIVLGMIFVCWGNKEGAYTGKN